MACRGLLRHGRVHVSRVIRQAAAGAAQTTAAAAENQQQLTTARSFAEASALAAQGGPHALILRRSEDMQCRNLMCEKIGGPCLCRVALVLSRCTRLHTLSLADNGLTALPEALFEAKGITDLDLSSNNLTELPRLAQMLPRLERLNVAGNPLVIKAVDLPQQLMHLTVSRDQVSDGSLHALHGQGLDVTVVTLDAG